MAINVSVQYNGGFLPDIFLLTLGYYHRGIRLNALKRFLPLQSMFPSMFPPVWGILRRFRCTWYSIRIFTKVLCTILMYGWIVITYSKGYLRINRVPCS